MVRFGVPGQNVDSLSYADSRLSTVPVVHAPRRPTVTDKKFPMWCEWRTNKESQSPVTEGEFWKLIRFESNGDATWVRVDISGTSPGIDDIRDQVDAAVGPDASGNIDIDGNAVNNGANPSGIPLESVADTGTNTLDINLQVATARTGAPGDKNDAGICSFDDTAFVVDGDGYVTLAGGAGPAVDSVDVDFNTGPGTDPVVPDANGLMAVFGNTVTNATNANAPVATHSRAANQYQVDVQLGAAIAASPADPYDAGLISGDNRYFSVDGNGFMSITDVLLQMPVGTTYNIGINYSSPTFKVTSSDGTALSATNPGYVVLPSTSSAGYKVVHEITSDISFDDDSGTSDLTGNTWGTTTTVAWNSAMPMFIYAVAEDANASATFMISRVPHRTTAPASGNIAKSGSAVASTQGSFFAIDSGVTVTAFDGNPCIVVGSFRITKNDAANDDWTVTALTAQDGIGRFQEEVTFSLPADQNGASSANLSSSVGGDTIPTFNNTAASYKIARNGLCEHFWNYNNISSGGSGTGILRIHIPFTNSYSVSWANPAGNMIFLNQAGGTWTTLVPRIYNTLLYFEVVFSGTGTAKLTPGGLTTDKNQGSFNVTYRVNTG